VRREALAVDLGPGSGDLGKQGERVKEVLGRYTGYYRIADAETVRPAAGLRDRNGVAED
jgi:hypothetical protein